MADLGVKPAIAAVAVMPVLGVELQPVREGVRALEDKEHTRRWRKPFCREGWVSWQDVASSPARCHRGAVRALPVIGAMTVRRNS